MNVRFDELEEGRDFVRIVVGGRPRVVLLRSGMLRLGIPVEPEARHRYLHDAKARHAIAHAIRPRSSIANQARPLSSVRRRERLSATADLVIFLVALAVIVLGLSIFGAPDPTATVGR